MPSGPANFQKKSGASKSAPLTPFEEKAKEILNDIAEKLFLEKTNLTFFQKLRGVEITEIQDRATGEKRPLATINSLKDHIAKESQDQSKPVVLSHNLWKILEKDSRSADGGYIFQQLKNLLDAGMLVNKEAIKDTEYTSRYSDQKLGGGREMMMIRDPKNPHERSKGDTLLSFDQFCGVCQNQFKQKGDKDALKLLEYCTKAIDKQQSLFAEEENSLAARNQRLKESQSKNPERENQSKESQSNKNETEQNKWRDLANAKAKEESQSRQ